MSTPEEKRRILQQRRQAKMANGRASDRLNAILTEGSSVQTASAKSVLEKPAYHAHDDDPDTADIDQLISNRASPSFADAPPDMEKLFSGLFGDTGASGEDPISALMMNMMKQQQQEAGEPAANLQDVEYEQKLLAYHEYKQKQLKFQFLVVRYFAVVINFAYHLATDATFRASSYSYVRSVESASSSRFLAVFLSVEAVILSTYYVLSSRRKVTQNISSDSIVLKIVSMAAMVVPLVAKFQPLLIQVLGYWEIFGMFLGDLSLIIVLFGVTSFLK